MKHNFHSDCVAWPKEKLDLLIDIQDKSIEITRKTFLQHVNQDQLKDMAQQCGYALHHTQGLTMAADNHVSYHRAIINKRTYYYFCWSGIEFVFV